MIYYSSLLKNKEEISSTILAELQEVQDQFELEASKAFSQMVSKSFPKITFSFNCNIVDEFIKNLR